MKKLLMAVALCGVLGLTVGMLAQPAISADDAKNAAASADDAKAPPADDVDTSTMGAEPAGEPAQGDASAEEKGDAAPEGTKE